MIFIYTFTAILCALAFYTMPDLLIVPIAGGLTAAGMFLGWQILKWGKDVVVRLVLRLTV